MMKLALITVMVSVTGLSACTSTPVKVWEKGDLARVDMRWQPDPMESGLRQHVHTAKEAAAGGVGTAGGGCGCY